jgi:hypothetical protein
MQPMPEAIVAEGHTSGSYEYWQKEAVHLRAIMATPDPYLTLDARKVALARAWKKSGWRRLAEGPFNDPSALQKEARALRPPPPCHRATKPVKAPTVGRPPNE